MNEVARISSAYDFRVPISIEASFFSGHTEHEFANNLGVGTSSQVSAEVQYGVDTSTCLYRAYKLGWVTGACMHVYTYVCIGTVSKGEGARLMLWKMILRIGEITKSRQTYKSFYYIFVSIHSICECMYVHQSESRIGCENRINVIH